MFTTKSITCLFSVLVMIVFMVAVTPLQAAQAAGVLYVKPAASGTGDCSSWVNACVLQTALTGVVSGNEIWVAAGTYKPTTNTTNRTATFQLIGGVAVYGGFVGTETARDQRNPTTNVTILSGDIDNNDSQTPIITNLATVTGNTTNSYHVVTGGAILDGFTITAGNANGTSSPNYFGGGMYNGSSDVTNVTFSGNSASNLGGGMYNWGSSTTLTNVTFSGNSTGGGGGGMYNFSSSPTLTNVTFSGNSAASYGGGLRNYYSSPTLTNVTFSGNSAFSGGGLYNFFSSPTLTNVTFSGNSARASSSGGGGGMYNHSSSPTLTNVTFSGNSSAKIGGGLYNESYSSTTSCSPTIYNTIFWGNIASSGAQIYNADTFSKPFMAYNVVQDGCPTGSTCTIIITTDPKLGTLGNYGGFTQTIPLLLGSSAIDTGNDATCPATDQRGVVRPQGVHCDIGAYELVQYLIYLPLVIR